MKHLLIIGTIGLLLALLIGSQFYSNEPFMMLATTSSGYQLLRLELIGLLFGLLVTTPPRHVYFRAVLGVTAVVLVAVATQLVMSYQLAILDGLVFVELAIIFAIESLEVESRRLLRPLGATASH